MELLIAALISGAFVAMTLRLVRRNRARLAPGAAPRLLTDGRGLEALEPQDVLSVEGADYIVAQVWSFSGSGQQWREARVEDASLQRWVVVGLDDAEGLLFGREIELLGLTAEPSESFEFEGQVYQLVRHGTAERLDPRTPVRFWEYARPGDARLWVRELDQARRAFAGQRVACRQVEFLPGS